MILLRQGYMGLGAVVGRSSPFAKASGDFRPEGAGR
jgi:hypothetical protein